MQAPITIQPNLIRSFGSTSIVATEGDCRILSDTVYGEARGETYFGKLAVAWSIRNRVQVDLWGDNKPDWWGETITQVCLKPWQFTCHHDHNKDKIRAVTLSDPVYRECMLAALAVIMGREPDPTWGATHYQVVGTRAKWSIGHTPICTIGHHEFFVGIEPGDPKHRKV